MATKQKKNNQIQSWIILFCTFVTLGYFGIHAFSGNFGIYSHNRMEKEIIKLQEKLDDLKIERKNLKSKVQLLHDGTLERDMLDQQARYYLNLIHPDEIIVFYN